MTEPSPPPSVPWAWIVGALLVVGVVAAALWWTAPPDNTLPDVYSVM